MLDGRLLFARYALMPNRLGYCGGNEHSALLDYCIEGRADRGLEDLERQFQAAYPYLEFIGHENRIADPFDSMVVEAYWIGNRLLHGVDMKGFYRFLEDRIGPRISRKALQLLLGMAPAGARPHHSFHVLDVSVRTGALQESMDDLDRCRISWGVVARVEGEEVIVQRSSLELTGRVLSLGSAREYRARFRIGDRGYLPAPAPGDVVSIHWGWVCDVLDVRQAASLEAQTRHHLALGTPFE